MKKWFSFIGCEHVKTLHYHARSNFLTERSARTLKDYLRCAGKEDLQGSMDRFFIQYRNSKHSTTGMAHFIFMRGQLLQSPVTALSSIGSDVWIKKYLDKEQLWEPAVFVGHKGRNVVNVKLPDGRYQRCHTEQTKAKLESMVENEKKQVPQEVHDSCIDTEESKERDNDHVPLHSWCIVNSRPKRNRKVPDRLVYQ